MKNCIEAVFTGRLGNNLYTLLKAYAFSGQNMNQISFYNKPDSFDEYKKTIFRNFSTTKIVNNSIYKVYESELKELCKNKQRISFYSNISVSIDCLKNFIELISCPKDLSNKILEKYPDIKDYVSIHVRRGDYLKYASRFQILDEEYFSKAIDILEKTTNEKYKYLIFSDDLTWCKKHFKEKNISFFDENDPIFSLYAMSFCKHNIIANSTYSQWGNNLNKNSNKVVVFPSRYNIENTKNNFSTINELKPICANHYWTFKDN